jgi:hypothetical protein
MIFLLLNGFFPYIDDKGRVIFVSVDTSNIFVLHKQDRIFRILIVFIVYSQNIVA